MIFRKSGISGISIISLKKDHSTDWVFTLMLIHRKKALSLNKFSRMLEYLLEANSVEVIAGDFN